MSMSINSGYCITSCVIDGKSFVSGEEYDILHYHDRESGKTQLRVYPSRVWMTEEDYKNFYIPFSDDVFPRTYKVK